MPDQRNKVDTATGASPPRLSTRETACSPVHFQSMNQTSSDESTCCSTIVDQDDDNVNGKDLMNKMVHQQSMISFPSPPCNGCTNSTPVLSISSTQPVPLMSIKAADTYGFNSNNNRTTSTNSINKHHISGRHWPVDEPSRYDSRYHQRQSRSTRRYKAHHHEHQPYHYRKHVGRPRAQISGSFLD
ncbi:unnamed protein product [Adineta steineri]|uniref:Uncharacterized protein n=1 Tax=Adineta steineri TaxID=433720 RepID=A0A819ZNW8_9BILA|nr:unnamed protein product [Adineta steineri]CAF4176929.1 unnamed protein product [Adineta steineri]CAF4176941.1 unnamed protein product [Adineta steineri]